MFGWNMRNRRTPDRVAPKSVPAYHPRPTGLGYSYPLILECLSAQNTTAGRNKDAGPGERRVNFF